MILSSLHRNRSARCASSFLPPTSLHPSSTLRETRRHPQTASGECFVWDVLCVGGMELHDVSTLWINQLFSDGHCCGLQEAGRIQTKAAVKPQAVEVPSCDKWSLRNGHETCRNSCVCDPEIDLVGGCLMMTSFISLGFTIKHYGMLRPQV